jgi:hypothetical protein
MNDIVKIAAGPHTFRARLEDGLAPATCAAFRAMLPYDERVIHVRWSGEGMWIPMGDREFDLPWESNTSFPAPGQFIFYPKGISETEILLAYGGVRFASKAGQLSGNHFMTIFEGLENLTALGKMTLWEGAQPIRFEIENA